MLEKSDESKEILFGNYLTLNEIELSKALLSEISSEKRKKILMKVMKEE